jgi:hypothetical protein
MRSQHLFVHDGEDVAWRHLALALADGGRGAVTSDDVLD